MLNDFWEMNVITHQRAALCGYVLFTIANNYLLFILSHIYCVIVSVLDRRANLYDPQSLYLRSRYY